jgi:hypothetical protein
MSIGTAGGQGIGIVAMILGIFDTEVIEIDVLVRFGPAKGHDHVDEEPDSMLVARLKSDFSPPGSQTTRRPPESCTTPRAGYLLRW